MKTNATDSPNYDAACILFPDLPASWFVDANPRDMYYALSVGIKLGVTQKQEKLLNRLLYDYDHGKLDTIYINEITDTRRKKEAEEYYNFEPPAKDWQRSLLALSPYFASCKELVKDGAMKMCAYKMLEDILGSWPSIPFDKKCVEALEIVASIAGVESPSFKGGKRHLRNCTDRLEKGIQEMGGFGGRIKIKDYSEKTLQRKKEEIKKEFFREGKTKEEWKALADSAFILWAQMTDENDRGLLEVIHNDSWAEWQKLVPEKERLKRSLKAEIMKERVRD